MIIKNVRNVDPTRTLTLRKKAVADMKRRFVRIKRLVTESLVVNDAFGLTPKEPVSRFASIVLQQAAEPDQFADMGLDEQALGFSEWLSEEERSVLLEEYGGTVPVVTAASFWFFGYLLQAFIKGVQRAKSELAVAGYPVQPLPPTTDYNTLLSLPQYRDRLAYILNRSYDELQNITSAMNVSIQRILVEGLVQGLSPIDIARSINKQIEDIGIRRATMLARTEIIAAHHAANIAEYRAAGVLGVRVLAEWLTAGDKRVCPQCRDLATKDMGNGPGVYTLDQIEFLIPAHPNCRCVAIPLDVTDSKK